MIDKLMHEALVALHRELTHCKDQLAQLGRASRAGGSVAEALYLGEQAISRAALCDTDEKVVRRLIAAAEEGLRLGEIAVRAGLTGFSQKDEDDIVANHTSLKEIRSAVAEAKEALS